MGKTALVLTFVTSLLFSAVLGTLVTRTVSANFYAKGTTPPPSGTEAPAILVFSPENKSYAAKELPLVFNVSSATCPLTSSFSLPEVYYKADWMANESFAGYGSTFNLRLNFLSEGVHVVTVRAEQGCFYDRGDGPYYFRIENQTTIKFMIDNTAPHISVNLKNITESIHDVSLSFSVNEPFSEATYSLDNLSDVKVNGDTTLSNLSTGIHNVTVYARDDAGNVGASETLTFTVAEPEQSPFPTTVVAVVSGAAIVSLGAGLLVYFRKKRHQIIYLPKECVV